MTTAARFKFAFGIIGVLLIVGMLFLYLDFSMSRARSVQATLDADTYTIGTDYSGMVVNLFAQVGQTVKKGDPIFEIRSSSLNEALATGKVNASSLIFELTEEQNILLSAADSGTVRQINYQVGAFVPANSTLAVVNKADSMFVVATYHLAPPDYQRIAQGSILAVTLPNNEKVTGAVYDISLSSKDNVVETVVKARLPDIQNTKAHFATGTPVKADMQLTNKVWYRSITDMVRDLFSPKEG